ncbi:MAG: sulfur carrier protein ThiS [Alphaproteobacteria bacterium]|jgi:thiamine biosynthesis protein ThiS
MTEARITVNGEDRAYHGETIVEIVAATGLDPARAGIAVALNGAIARRATWADTRLAPGDRMEIVQSKTGG